VEVDKTMEEFRKKHDCNLVIVDTDNVVKKYCFLKPFNTDFEFCCYVVKLSDINNDILDFEVTNKNNILDKKFKGEM
jgi:hypothetical protein